MNPIPSKFALAAAATLFLTAGAAFADLERVRIDHPNGPSTYSLRESNRPSTVGIYAGEQGANTATVVQVPRSENRAVPIHNGRGQTQWVKTNPQP